MRSGSQWTPASSPSGPSLLSRPPQRQPWHQKVGEGVGGGVDCCARNRQRILIDALSCSQEGCVPTAGRARQGLDLQAARGGGPIQPHQDPGTAEQGCHQEQEEARGQGPRSCRGLHWRGEIVDSSSGSIYLLLRVLLCRSRRRRGWCRRSRATSSARRWRPPRRCCSRQRRPRRRLAPRRSCATSTRSCARLNSSRWVMELTKREDGRREMGDDWFDNWQSLPTGAAGCRGRAAAQPGGVLGHGH